MTKKLIQQASVTQHRDDFPKGNLLDVFSLPKKELKKLEKAPLILLKELKEFIERNSIIKINGEVSHKYCCQNCLKAHIKKKAKEININKEQYALAMSVFDGDIGHKGYYLDKEDLIKI